MTLAVVDVARDGSGLEIVAAGDRAAVEETLRSTRPGLSFRRFGRRLIIDWACALQLDPDMSPELEWTEAAAAALGNRRRVRAVAETVVARVDRIRANGPSAARALISDGSLV